MGWFMGWNETGLWAGLWRWNFTGLYSWNVSLKGQMYRWVVAALKWRKQHWNEDVNHSQMALRWRTDVAENQLVLTALDRTRTGSTSNHFVVSTWITSPRYRARRTLGPIWTRPSPGPQRPLSTWNGQASNLSPQWDPPFKHKLYNAQFNSIN